MRLSYESAASPLLDWTASRIPDPVIRLRYLRAAAPAVLEPKRRRPRAFGWLVAGLVALVAPLAPRFLSATEPRVPPPAPVSAQAAVPVAGHAPDLPPDVWLVEKTEQFESYSNGLRIENRYAVTGRPRSYVAFPLSHPESRGRAAAEPVGIVFHTTESLLAPFEPAQNAHLKQVGESLLEYVRRRGAYNFVIDRFGRVFRVVRESDAANHAGHSVWADGESIYINLNDSFLGVSFEARTGASRDLFEFNPAQIRAGAMLTEMLRARYRIAARNCVTHAQVSVNPANMQIGYHTDWASDFPFDRLGLPDNYAGPLPSLPLFGFRYDSGFRERAGPRLTRSAELGERPLIAQAAAAGLPIETYRKSLNVRYSRLAASIN